MKKLAALFLAVLGAILPGVGTPIARAGEPQIIPLWENGAPGFEKLKDAPEEAHDYWVRHINNPTLTVFPAPKEKANGTAVLIMPGGGFREVVYQAEGVEPAHYLNNLGVTCFVLKYRLPRETNSPYSLQIHPAQDGRRAMRVIRSRASNWKLDPRRIGVLGFSAGCEVEAWLVYGPTPGDPSAPDPIDRMNCQSDFQMVIYPGPLGIPEGAISPAAPPAFFVVANDDLGHESPVLAELQKYHEVNRPVEVHIYEHGGHGFNLGQRSKYVSIKDWPQRMTDWMADNGLLDTSGSRR